MHNAVKERASDLHLEPFENELRVRFRIDNVLYEPIKPLPKALQASIVSRIKIMGRLNIAEKRLPQDGRIRLKIAGRDYDVRLSTLPVAYGERVVMRLLPRTQELLDLTTLGFDEQQLATMSKLITRPNGIVLVTGPDRQRQDHHALRRALADQRDRQEHHHDRGPGRDPAARASARSR